MIKNNSKILVPVDFTKVSESAIRHAIVYAKITGYDISLLHVIEKPLIYIGGKSKFNNQLVEEATVSRLQKMADDIKKEHKLSVDIIAKPGNIFDTINDVAFEIGAKFILMGTHGVKGMQHIMGSNALKVIYNSVIPYIVVQDCTPKKIKLDNIVFPIDFKRQTKEKAFWAIYIAKKFNSKINILVPNETDTFLLNKVTANLSYTEKLFEKNGIAYTVKASDKDFDDLTDETISYSKEINADMIMIMTFPDKGAGGATDFFFSPSQQKIITNSLKKPVMCINPRQDTYIRGNIKQ